MAKNGEVPTPRNAREQAIFNAGFEAGVEAARSTTREGRRQVKQALKSLDATPPLPAAAVELPLETTRIDNPALGMPKEIQAPLKREGIVTLEQLVDTSDDDLLVIRGLGRLRIREIDQTLGRFGLKRRSE